MKQDRNLLALFSTRKGLKVVLIQKKPKMTSTILFSKNGQTT